MKQWIGEPLVHFLVIGAALFAIFGVAGKPGGGASGAIVVTKAQIDLFAAGFEHTWQRPPTSDELSGLIEDRVREEVYVREAIALGLDKDDTVIRRRLRQKMEFVSEDAATGVEPADAELNAYLTAHPDAYRIDARFTFRHVFLDPKRHGASLANDARQLLAKLNAAGKNADISRVGDRYLLPITFDAAPRGVIARQFGEKFTAKLAELNPGRWEGPIESDHGAHLVFLEARVAGRTPELAEVRDAVKVDWTNAKRLEANEAFYKELLKRYKVTIQNPSDPGAKK